MSEMQNSPKSVPMPVRRTSCRDDPVGFVFSESKSTLFSTMVIVYLLGVAMTALWEIEWLNLWLWSSVSPFDVIQVLAVPFRDYLV